MTTAKELYNYEDEIYFWGPNNYQPMLDSFGTIVIQVDDNNYQGDSRVLYQSGSMFGWLQFGWGSCSGCDALQACENIEEVQELMNELQNSIKWFFDKEEAIEFFETHDWKGDYSYWNNGEQKVFIDKVLKFLKGL